MLIGPQKAVGAGQGLDFSQVDDPSWFGGNAAISHWFDTYTMLVPENESFYIRTLRHVLPTANQSEKEVLRRFFAQESQHGIAHGIYINRMQELGLRTERFTSAVNFLLYSVLEPLQPLALRMAIVAAIEHVNAIMANIMLTRDEFADAPESMRRLFYWHFAEEIEHKSVAHDFLTRRHPGYLIRVLGGILGFTAFYFALFFGMCVLLKQRKRLFTRLTLTELRAFWITDGILAATTTQLRRYFSKRFDPWSLNDQDVASSARANLQSQLNMR